MADGFCRSLLRITMAQICQELGWHAIHSTPCDLLTDILQRYMQQLATMSHQYAEQYGRTQPDLDDLGLAFRQMGISLYELENYIKDVDPIPFKYDIPQFPIRRENNLQHPKPGSRDDRERLQYIPAYLPPIIGLSDDFGEPIGHHRDSISSIPGTPMDTDSPDSRLLSPGGNSHTSPRGEKRETSSPLFSEQAMKRLRLDGDGTPQELTAVSMSISGELTPKREGRLPIATTPPQRSLKVAIPSSDIPIGGAQKAITDRLLTKSEDVVSDKPQPKSPKGAKPITVDPKSPKSKTPVPPKPKPQTKSPKHLLFSPNASSKYPLIKPKAISGLTPLSGDKGSEFQFPPPKSPKASLSSLGSFLIKKSQEKQQDPASKQEKAALKVYDFDDDDLDSKPASAAREPQSSPTEPTGPYKEPSAFMIPDDSTRIQTASSASISAAIDAVVLRNREEMENRSSPTKELSVKVKKLGKEKDKTKTIIKDKSKIKPKLKTKKSRDDIPTYYDSIGSLDSKESKSDKKHAKTLEQVVKKSSKDSDVEMYGKTPKLVIRTGREKSKSGDHKVIKKKIKSSKLKEKEKQKHLKVKKIKQKSLKLKVKSKSPNLGTVPSATKPKDDFSPEKLKPIGKLNIIKSSGSSLQFKIARPIDDQRDSNKKKEKKPSKEKLKKVAEKQKQKTAKKIKLSSDKEKKVKATEKIDSLDKEKKHVSKDKKKNREKKDEKSRENTEKKSHGKSESSEKDKAPVMPVVPKITFKLGATPAGGDSPKIVIKTTVQRTPSPKSLPLFTPAIPKISIPIPGKKSKNSTKSSRSVSSIKVEAKPKGESKPKMESKIKTETKVKGESKPKSENKQKSAKKKEKEAEKEKERNEREKEEKKEREKEEKKEREKEKKEREKEKERKEREKEKEKKEKEKERKEREKEKEKKEKEKEKKEREKEKEKKEKEKEKKEKEKREREKEKEKEREIERERKEREKEKEKEKAKEKVREEVKPKAIVEVSPYDFDAPSPMPTIKTIKKESTPLRKEPKPGIFAPSVPSPTNSKPSTSQAKSSASSKSSSQPVVKPTTSSTASPQKASIPTLPPTKAALKALPSSAKASKSSSKQKEKEKGKAAPPKPASPPPQPPPTATTTAPTVQPEGPCTLIMETAGTVIREDGEKIWICPGCKKQDDGSPMIGCDSCDDWYHWVCVGIKQEPSEDSWFCERCSTKTKGKKKRGKKR